MGGCTHLKVRLSLRAPAPDPPSLWRTEAAVVASEDATPALPVSAHDASHTENLCEGVRVGGGERNWELMQCWCCGVLPWTAEADKRTTNKTGDATLVSRRGWS